MDIKKIFCTLALLSSATAVAEDDARECRVAPLRARMGDARNMVYCEGYDVGQYIANNEKLISVEIGAYEKPSLRPEYLPGSARIENPKSNIEDLLKAIDQYGSQILSGKIKSATEFKNEIDRAAVDEILTALAKSDLSSRNQGRLGVTSFKIAATANLYVGPNTRYEIAPFSTKTDAEREEEKVLKAKAANEAQKKEYLEKRFNVKIQDTLTLDSLSSLDQILKTPRQFTCLIEKNRDSVRLNLSHSSATMFIYGASIEIYLKELGVTQQECQTGITFNIADGKRVH